MSRSARPPSAVAVNAAATLVSHARMGNVNWPCAGVFAVTGMVGAYGGSSLSKVVDGHKLLVLFALLMLVIAAVMFVRRAAAGDPDVKLTGQNLPRLAGTGFLTGALSGFFGIGGGFLIVPGLMFATGMVIINAVGSSLVAVTAFGATAAFNYARSDLVDWRLAAVFILGGVCGGLAGGQAAKALGARRGALNMVFAGIIVVVALYMLARSLLVSAPSLGEGMPDQFVFEIAPSEPISALVYAAPEPADVSLILGHGAGAGQTSAFLVNFATALASRGIETITFNFAYTEAGRRVPDRNDRLEAAWRRVIAAYRGGEFGARAPRLAIGGKSMGGRIASQVAAGDGRGGGDGIAGLVFLGYPLHPPGRPDKLRSAHLPRHPRAHAVRPRLARYLRHAGGARADPEDASERRWSCAWSRTATTPSRSGRRRRCRSRRCSTSFSIPSSDGCVRCLERLPPPIACLSWDADRGAIPALPRTGLDRMGRNPVAAHRRNTTPA